MQELHEEYSDEGLSVVAINIVSEQEELVPGFIEEHGLTFPVLVGAETNQVVSDDRLVSTPLSLILDRDGKIIGRLDGYGPGSEERLRSQVVAALEREDPSSPAG